MQQDAPRQLTPTHPYRDTHMHTHISPRTTGGSTELCRPKAARPHRPIPLQLLLHETLLYRHGADGSIVARSHEAVSQPRDAPQNGPPLIAAARLLPRLPQALRTDSRRHKTRKRPADLRVQPGPAPSPAIRWLEHGPRATRGAQNQAH